MDLADHLRSWTPEALTGLLGARPDLLPASDEGFEALARKASTALSLGRCLVRSDVAMLVVAQALAVASPATADEIDALLGTNDVDAVLDALARLAGRGVVVVEDGVVNPVGALDDLMHRPMGLGPSFVELADQVPPEVFDDMAHRLGVVGAAKRSATARAIAKRLSHPDGLAVILAGATSTTVELLESLVEQRSPAVGLPVGYLYQHLSDDDPLAWMLNRGILVAVSDGGGRIGGGRVGGLAELPREIVIASRPQGLAPTAALRPIEVRPVVGLAVDVVGSAAADRASTALEAAESLLRLAAEGAVSVRRSGGVGVREAKRLAKILDLEARDVGRLLELLLEARLIQLRSDRVMPTELAAPWWRLTRGRRWLVLVRAWVGSSAFISSALSLDVDGRPVPALIDHDMVAAAFAGRQIMIEAITSLGRGEAYDPDQLTEAVVWRSPNLWGTGDPAPEELVTWTLEEAELLGLVANNAATPTLMTLASGDDAQLEELVAVTLGHDQDQLVLQSDLTAVALGPLDPKLAGELAELADRQPGSSVPIFRFSESSIRRGFDRGWTVATISEFLTAHALSGVPQPLTYLLSDVERRYGTVKVMEATAVIVTADEATAVEIASTARAARLGLRLIAPTVLIGPAEARQLLDELRTEGFFPVLHGDNDNVGPDGEGQSSDGNDDGLPADWTGPVLTEAALPGEVADAVDALRSNDTPSTVGPAAKGAKPGSTDHRLHLLWNRMAVVTYRRDGELAEVRGVVVAIDESLTLLSENGVEELPLDAVVTVEDPTR
ncbi:MAG: helicase-associated domain-containing protein [Actinomycetia bacterium]|nr:helicase-associated domain-containing protein [Actinomycetes bacterium]